MKSKTAGAVVLAARLSLPALIAVYCVAFLLNLSGMPAEAANYPRLTIVITLLLVVSSMVGEFKEWRKASSYLAISAPRIWQRSRRSVSTIVLLASFVYAMPRLGFYPAAAIYLLALFLILGLRDPVRVAALIAGILLASYLLFTVILQVLLPRGPFELG